MKDNESEGASAKQEIDVDMERVPSSESNRPDDQGVLFHITDIEAIDFFDRVSSDEVDLGVKVDSSKTYQNWRPFNFTKDIKLHKLSSGPDLSSVKVKHHVEVKLRAVQKMLTRKSYYDDIDSEVVTIGKAGTAGIINLRGEGASYRVHYHWLADPQNSDNTPPVIASSGEPLPE